MAARWQPGTPAVTAADLPAVLAGHPVVVIHFWAIWNGVDRRFAQVLAAVRPEFEGRIAFRSADVDDEELFPFFVESEVVNVPALGCFVGGRRVKTVMGFRPAAELRAEFDALLSESGHA